MGGGHSKDKTRPKKNRKQQEQLSHFVGLLNDEPDKGSYNPRSAWSSDNVYPSLSDHQNCVVGVSRNKDKPCDASKTNTPSSSSRASKSGTCSHVDNKLTTARTSVPNDFFKTTKPSSTKDSQSSSFVDFKPSTHRASAQYHSYETKTKSRREGLRNGSTVASGPSNTEAKENLVRDDKYAPSAPVLGHGDQSSHRFLQSAVGTVTADFRQHNVSFPPKWKEKVSGPGQSESHNSKNGGKPGEEMTKPHPLQNKRPRSNQGAHCERRKSSNVEECEEEPPKYEEAIKQPKSRVEMLQNNKANEKYQPPNVDCVSRKEKRPAEQETGVQKSTIKVDELNDWIKKQFGYVGGPIGFLSNVDMSDKPFPARNRLFFRNLPPNTTRNDLEKLLSCYGEITVDFIDNDTRVCCLRVKQQAEIIQRNMDGFVFRKRTLRVHFGNRDVRFKVLNLDQWVTNELLKKAFTIFGEVERAEVFLDTDGCRTGEGYLEFANKKGGQLAYESCKEGCFLLTASLRPVILSKLNPDVGCRGNYQTYLLRKNRKYLKDRQVGPRFVAEGSPEYKYAILWKELIEKRRAQEKELEKKLVEEEEKICTQIEVLQKSEETRLKAKYSHPSCR